MLLGRLLSFINHVKLRFMRKSLQFKLMLYSSVAILLTGFFTHTILFSVIANNTEDQIRYSASQSYEQAYQFIESKLQNMLAAADAVYFDDTVQNMLINAQKEKYDADIIEQYQDMREVESVLSSFAGDDLLISLYVPDTLIFAQQNHYFFPRSSLVQWDELMAQSNRDLWLPPEQIRYIPESDSKKKRISLLRKIRNRDDVGDVIGVLRVSILSSSLEEIIDKSNITEQGIVYVYNSKRQILLCSNRELAKGLSLFADPTANSLMEKQPVWRTCRLGQGKYLVNARDVENTDWKLVAMIPSSEVFYHRGQLGLLLAALLAVMTSAACFFTYWLSRSMTDRIKHLSEKMEQVRDGNLEVSVENTIPDEVGRLMESFNYMVSELEASNKRVFESGAALKGAELRALQAQINPHFLYNTLDLMNWEALEHDVPELAELSRSLARFYKLSLNKGRDMVPVSDELEHVSLYVQIQNYRFDARIQLTLEVPEQYHSYMMPKLVIQPLVENAIQHGISEEMDRRILHIHITGRQTREDGRTEFQLIVIDDGVGMSSEKLVGILSQDAQDTHGYGVRNIHQRLQLCYGEQWGLSYQSQPGKGTTVYLHLPEQG